MQAMQRIDKEEIKRLASGHWHEIIPALSSIPAGHLDGKGHPCPLNCSDPGTDRFYTHTDFDRTGGAGCRHCFSTKNGDGFALLGKVNGWDFQEQLSKVAEYLGTAPAAQTPAKPKPTSKPKKTYPDARQAMAAANWQGLVVETLHEYLSRAGDLLAVVMRLLDANGKKTFLPVMQQQDGQWIVGTIDPRPLYGLELLDSPELVIVCEGEKTANALRSLGFVAITWMSGAQSWTKADWQPLVNCGAALIVLLPDNDDPGNKAMDGIEQHLLKLSPDLRIKNVQVRGIIELGEGMDAADLVEKYEGDTETPKRLILEAIEAAELTKPVKPGPANIEGTEAPNLAEISGQTDEANGRRLWLRNKGRFAWCHSWKSFVNYDGRRWTRDESMVMASMAIETYRSLYDELKSIGHNLSSDALRGITSYIKKSGSSNGKDAMLDMVKSLPGVPVTPSEFNRDTELFNCENGTIDLRTGKIRAHCADDKITQIAPVVYDPAATCPNWLAFIELIFKGNADLIRYVQAAAGYSLTGSQAEQSLFFCYGKGSNGKSTFLNTLKEICGDYGLAASENLLLTNSNEQHPTALTDLFGRRWVNCIEADEGKRLNESTVKIMTGGEAIRARGMRENFYEFPPTHKIWLAANHKPTVRGDDDGIWRRIKLIPFAHKFTDDQKDTKFPEKLRSEWSGILNWALAGLADWRANGLIVPSVVALASNEYRAEQDRLGDWIADRCIVSSGTRAKASTLYADYSSWAGIGAMSSTSFGTKLAERYEKKRGNGIWYVGIGLAAKPTNDDPDMEGLE